ncbi:hypothetical protein GCM10009696_09080 [Kocuria himachalensis]
MELQLHVRTENDPAGSRARLVVTGQLTEFNYQMLYQVICRARALTPGTQTLVDLTGAEPVETAAVDLLAWEIDHHDPDGPLSPVGFVVPGPPVSSSRTGAALGPRTVWTGQDMGGPGHVR